MEEIDREFLPGGNLFKSWIIQLLFGGKERKNRPGQKLGHPGRDSREALDFSQAL